MPRLNNYYLRIIFVEDDKEEFDDDPQETEVDKVMGSVTIEKFKGWR